MSGMSRTALSRGLLQITQTPSQLADRLLAPWIGRFGLEVLDLALEAMCVCDSLLVSSHRNAPLEFSKVDVQALPRNEVALGRNRHLVPQIRAFATALGAKRCLGEPGPPNVRPAIEAHEVVVGWHRSVEQGLF